MQKRRVGKVAWIVGLTTLAGSSWAVDLDERFDRTLRRVQEGEAPRYDDALLLADLLPRPVRRFTNFSGDLSGRYIGALSAAAEHREIPEERLRLLVREAVRLQRSDGSFGDPWSGPTVTDGAMAKMWGNGRMLVGLLDFYAHAQDPGALQAARKLGDFLVSQAATFHEGAVLDTYSRGRRALGYICWTQNIEGLAVLSRVTGDVRYRDAASEIAERVRRVPGQHSHGLLSSLRGILEIYRQDGNARWLRLVEDIWSAISDSRHLARTGSVAEYLETEVSRDEGCSIADWLRLSLELWRQTLDPRYLEAAERSWFNGFAMNQFSSGDFGHVYWSESGYGFGGERAWWCCTLHGLRAFPDVTDAAFREREGTLLYDFAVDAVAQSNEFSVRAEAALRNDSAITLRVERIAGQPRGLGVRMPPWSEGIELALNGRPLEVSLRNGYLIVERSWRVGDELSVRYRMRTQLLRDGPRLGSRAVQWGPWILGVSEESDPAFFGEGLERNRASLEDLAEDMGADGQRSLAFTHAGYSEQPQVAHLHPVAERGLRGGLGRWQVWLSTGAEAGPLEEALTALAPPVRGVLPQLLVAVAAVAVLVLLWWARRRSGSNPA